MKVDIDENLINHIEECLFENSFLRDKYFITLSTFQDTFDQEGLFADDYCEQKYLKILPHYYLEGTYRNDEYRNVLRSQYLFDSYWSSAYGMYLPVEDKIIIDLNAIANLTNILKYEKKCDEVSIEKLKRIVLIEQIAHRITRFGRKKCKMVVDTHFESSWINNPYYQLLISKIITYHCLDNNDRDLMEKYLPIVVYEVNHGTRQGSRASSEEVNYRNNIYETYLNDVNKLFQLILTIENRHLKNVTSSQELEEVIKNIELESIENILKKI